MLVLEMFGYPEPPNKERQQKLTKILHILDKDVKFQPFRDRIRIFGSVARNNLAASDIDIMVDFSDVDLGTGVIYQLDIPGIGIFLNLARHFYGYVDVFVRTKRFLAVRSDDARYWIKASNTRMLTKAAKTEGRSLDEVLANWPKDGLPS